MMDAGRERVNDWVNRGGGDRERRDGGVGSREEGRATEAVCVCVCVCVRARARLRACVPACLRACVCVCVRVRE